MSLYLPFTKNGSTFSIAKPCHVASREQPPSDHRPAGCTLIKVGSSSSIASKKRRAKHGRLVTWAGLQKTRWVDIPLNPGCFIAILKNWHIRIPIKHGSMIRYIKAKTIRFFCSLRFRDLEALGGKQTPGCVIRCSPKKTLTRKTHHTPLQNKSNGFLQIGGLSCVNLKPRKGSKERSFTNLWLKTSATRPSFCGGFLACEVRNWNCLSRTFPVRLDPLNPNNNQKTQAKTMSKQSTIQKVLDYWSLEINQSKPQPININKLWSARKTIHNKNKSINKKYRTINIIHLQESKSFTFTPMPSTSWSPLTASEKPWQPPNQIPWPKRTAWPLKAGVKTSSWACGLNENEEIWGTLSWQYGCFQKWWYSQNGWWK